ncbi:MAG TPA: ABC transporter permease [Acetobacteraceae bacterium]|jgi:lipopolysaccharide transport system permease protein|nr:ABC transporter permease [Acetobacteraceae bacterium]
MSMTSIPIESAALLDLRADMSFPARQRLAISDVTTGGRLWRLAWTLGWLDIKLRYRGSMLGPFWLTLSTGIMVGALGLLYASLFHMDLHDYLPFLSLSMVLWGFLSAMVSEACITFTEAEAVIRSVRMPFFLFSARVVIRNLLVLAHNIVVIVVVFVVFAVAPGWGAFLAIPGLALWLVDSLALSLLLGSFCARFRDIQPIVNSLMQIAFFMTPVIWKPEQAGRHFFLLQPNPFFDLLEVVRAPLLGTPIGGITWLGAGCYSLALWGVAWLLFVRARGRVSFWL